MIITVLAWLAAVMLGGSAVLAVTFAARRWGDRPEDARSALTAAAAQACMAMLLIASVTLSPAAIFAAAASAAAGAVLAWADERPAAEAIGDARAVAWLAVREARDRRRIPAAAAGAGVPDEVTLRRQARDVPGRRRAVAGDPRPVPAPPVSPPAPSGRTPRAVSPPPDRAPSGPAAVADALTAVHVLIAHALSGGMQDVDRTLGAIAEIQGQLADAVRAFGVRLSEPDQHFGHPVWEPVTQGAGHGHAGALALGEAISALRALAAMPMGEVSVSPAVQAPHHDKLNAGA